MCECDKDAALGRWKFAEHPRAHQKLKFRAVNASAIKNGLRFSLSNRPAAFCVRNGEALGNPAHGITNIKV